MPNRYLTQPLTTFSADLFRAAGMDAD
jgi:hypothetical protein